MEKHTAPEVVILDTRQEIAQLTAELADVDPEYAQRFAVQRIVADLMAQLYDKAAVTVYLRVYVEDCMEVFANLPGEHPSARSYGESLYRFGMAIYHKLLALHAYNEHGLLEYTVGEYLGDDVVLHRIH